MKQPLLLLIIALFLFTGMSYANPETVSVNIVWHQSTYDDFANVHIRVTASAHYHWFVAAYIKIYKWDGANWNYINFITMKEDWPYDGQEYDWSISNQDFHINNISASGDGLFKFEASVSVNDVPTVYHEVTVTITDVIAPSAPTNLSVTSSANNHPLLSWSPNSEADVDDYDIYKKKGLGNWNYLASTSGTSYEDTQEDVIGKYHQANATICYYKIKAVDFNGNESGYSNTVSILVEGEPLSKRGVIGGTGFNVPEQIALYQNYPNPFNPSTAIQFDLPEAVEVELTIYSLSGQRIATLMNENLEAGSYEVKWNGKDTFGNEVSSGIYLYQLKAGEKLFIKKMMLIK